MGKYDPLGEYLSDQVTRTVTLSFAEIEGILGTDLPNSARQHRPWWGNDVQGHSHAKCWLDAGWEVDRCSLPEQWVTFVRRQVGEPGIPSKNLEDSADSTQHDFSALYGQYPRVIDTMGEVFTSHEFILALARANQRLYIEALYSYRTSPAPFRAVHAILSKHLHSVDTLRYLGQIRSDSIFVEPSECACWQKG